MLGTLMYRGRSLRTSGSTQCFHRRCDCHRGLKGEGMADFQTVKSYVQELNLVIVSEDPAQDILVVRGL